MLRILFLLAIIPFTFIFAEDFTINPKSDPEFFEQIQKLQFGSIEERVVAADRLRFIRSKKAIRPLCNVLRGNPDRPLTGENSPYLKFTIAQTLAAIGHPAATTCIIEEFKNLEKQVKKEDEPEYTDPMLYKTVNAAGELLRALGRLPYNKTIQDTLTNALKHTNYYIRASAGDGLKFADQKENIASLVSALQDETRSYARTSILNAIVSLQHLANQYFFELTEQLADKDPVVRFRAAEALGEVNMREGELYLQKALAIEENATVRDEMQEDLQIVKAFKSPPPAMIFKH